MISNNVLIKNQSCKPCHIEINISLFEMQRTTYKVLFITTDSSANAGVGRSLVDALENIDRTIISPLVICPWEKPRTATICPKLKELYLPYLIRDLGKWIPSPANWGVMNMGKMLFGMKARVWSLVALIKKERIDLIYTNGLPCIDGALAARVANIPHVWHLREAIRNNHDLRGYLPSWLAEELIGRLSRLVVFNSEYLAKQFSRVALRTSIKVIHNGVTVSTVDQILAGQKDLSLRQELGIKTADSIILSVGTVAPRKGYKNLLLTAKLVKERFKDVVFLIAGAEVTDYAEELKELIKKLDLKENFLLLGPRRDIVRLMKESNIFVHSAQQEAFGRVLVEAMTLGLPTVSTRCGGPEEIILDNETGFLVPVDDPVTMSVRLNELLVSSDLREKMGNCGKTRAITNFSVKTYSSSIQNAIIDTLVKYHDR